MCYNSRAHDQIQSELIMIIINLPCTEKKLTLSRCTEYVGPKKILARGVIFT